ncbi:MAG TPA: tRNA lysidine(34) synthetase TilS [Candidatus Nanopelagicaceae bacterium]|nr:tRNA lysidine(34) synthetase TilS [Candidatus Nanopelagicaceae bacterium]
MTEQGSMAVVRHAVRLDLATLEPGDRILVACSGGADSSALAYALTKEAPLLAVSVTAVTIDHGLQEGSAHQAADTARWLREIGYDQVEIVQVQVGNEGGLEAAARDARYGALEAVAAGLTASAIYLGHSMDDQAESVLLGLGRGSGPRSIAGMEKVSGIYRRPFLGLRRSQLRVACLEVEAPIWDDPHNQDERFTRVGLRNLIPSFEATLGGGVVEALARTADLLREDLFALDSLTTPYVDRVEATVAELSQLPAALRKRAMRAMAFRAGVPGGSLTFDHLTRMDSLITDWRGQGGVTLPGDLTFSRKSGRLSFSSTGKVERGSR